MLGVARPRPGRYSLDTSCIEETARGSVQAVSKDWDGHANAHRAAHRVLDERIALNGSRVRFFLADRYGDYALDLLPLAGGRIAVTAPIVRVGDQCYGELDVRGAPPGAYAIMVRSATGVRRFGCGIAASNSDAVPAAQARSKIDAVKVAGSSFTIDNQSRMFASAYADLGTEEFGLRLSMADDIERFLSGETLEPGAPSRAIRFSVVTAVYNVEKYLDKYFESIIAQSLDFVSRIELILVDDGSTDRSAKIIKTWQRRYPESIHYIYKKNGGAGEARNVGMDRVTNEWVTFIDPDDFVHREYFFHVARAIRKYRASNPVMVSCNAIIYDESGDRLLNLHPLRHRFDRGERAVSISDLDKLIELSGATAFFRRDLFSSNDLRFDKRVRPTFEDGHLIARYLDAAGEGSAVFLPRALYYYRRRADGTSLNDNAKTTPQWYLDQIEFGYLSLLQDIKRKRGRIPRHLQNTVLYDLSWRFKHIVNRPRSIDFLASAEKARFQALLCAVFELIDAATIADYDIGEDPYSYRFGILNLYKMADSPRKGIAITALDRVSGVAKAVYWSRSEPAVSFLSDGLPMAPHNEVKRRHDFLGETFAWEYIALIAISGVTALSAMDHQTPIAIKAGGRDFDGSVAITRLTQELATKAPSPTGSMERTFASPAAWSEREGLTVSRRFADAGLRRELLDFNIFTKARLEMPVSIVRRKSLDTEYVRIGLGLRQRATDERIFVSCVMLTRDRTERAKLAVRCFQHQTWHARELIILDQSENSDLKSWIESLGDSRIRHIHMPGYRDSLGALRNLAITHASGTHVATWDDDDLSHPVRLEAQVAVLSATHTQANLLAREMMWIPSKKLIGALEYRPHENTLVCERSVMPAYPEISRGEDTAVVSELLESGAKVTYLDQPELYVYVAHGTNTWHDEHMTYLWNRATLTFAFEEYRLALAAFSRCLPIRQYLHSIEEIRSSEAQTGRVRRHVDALIDRTKPPRIDGESRHSFASAHLSGSLLRFDGHRAALAVKATLIQDGAIDSRPITLSLGDCGTVDPPLVSCLMVTRDRAWQAQLSIDCFQRQSWQNRELVILDSSDDDLLRQWVANLHDPRIRFFHMPGCQDTLGTMRNRAVELASGLYVCQWDDDDLSHPARIEAQMAGMTATDSRVAFLSRELMWMPRRSQMSILRSRTHENTMICMKSLLPRYPETRKGEDTKVVEALISTHRATCLDLPELYVYVVHGSNTWNPEHMDSQWQASTHRFVLEEYARAIAELSDSYPLDWYRARIEQEASGTRGETRLTQASPRSEKAIRVSPARSSIR